MKEHELLLIILLAYLQPYLSFILLAYMDEGNANVNVSVFRFYMS